MSVCPVFGQLVIGPAGSGKTTYCDVMSKYLQQLGRNVILVNIDPANDVLPYEPSIDISKLITVSDVMSSMGLGPNGALLYCIDFLDTNFDWLLNELQNAIEKLPKSDNQSVPYLLVDSPGQVELYTNHHSLKNIINKLNSLSKPNSGTTDESKPNSGTADDSKPMKTSIDLRLVSVNIIDSHYSTDASKFISVVMNCLNSMIHLEMPSIHVLSKVDLIQSYGKTDFGLDFYCDLLDLNYLVDKVSEDPFLAKYKKLTKALAGIIEDYSLVSFLPLDINNAKTVVRVLKSCDKANGYYMNDSIDEQTVDNILRTNETADFEHSKYNELLERLYE